VDHVRHAHDDAATPSAGKIALTARSAFEVRWLIRTALALVAIVCSATARADPQPMSAGGLPAPATSTTVALAREELVIEVNTTSAEVTAALMLDNRGPATRLEVGFPCERSVDPGVAALDCRTPITVTVDGKKVATRLRTTKGGKHWMWPMRFAADSRVSLQVSYRARLYNDRYQTPFFGMGILHYRLATGASWAGPVGELIMRVDLPTDALVHIAPGGYVREHGRVTWKLSEVEPSQDLAITVHPLYLGRAAAGVRASDRAAYVAALASGDVKKEVLLGVAGEMKKELAQLVEYAGWFNDVAGKKLGLPRPDEGETRTCLEQSIALMEQAAR
jgi:hypothetical protein